MLVFAVKITHVFIKHIKKGGKRSYFKEKKKVINLEYLIEQNININFNFSLRAASECPYKG